MRLQAWPMIRIAVSAVFVVAACSSLSLSQDSSPDEIQSLLREASALVPSVDKAQQCSVATNISGQQVRAGDLAGALATVRAVESQQGRIFAAGNIASMLAWRGNLPLALDLIRDWGKGNDPQKAQALVFVAQSLASKGDCEAALRVARMVQEGPEFFGRTKLFIDALMLIYAKQWETKDLAGAVDTANLALDAIRAMRDSSDTGPATVAMMYDVVASGLAQAGNREAALTVIERIYGMVASARNPQERQDILFFLAATQVGVGEIDAALSSAEQLNPGQQRDGIMAQAAILRMRQGNLQGALDDVATLPAADLRNIFLGVVSEAFYQSGNYTQALATVDLIRDPRDRANALASLALQQAKSDDPTSAQTLELAVQAALAASGTKPYVFGYIAVTKGLLGDFNGAEEIIAGMEDQSRWWALENLTTMLVHADKKTDAISLAESQIAPQTKAYALLGTATALIDKQREASRTAGDKTKQ
jgi:hypothetical protein